MLSTRRAQTIFGVHFLKLFRLRLKYFNESLKNRNLRFLVKLRVESFLITRNLILRFCFASNYSGSVLCWIKTVQKSFSEVKSDVILIFACFRRQFEMLEVRNFINVR